MNTSNMTAKATTLILGSCLVLQIPGLLKSTEGSSDLSSTSQQEELPRFHETHSRELMLNSEGTTAAIVGHVADSDITPLEVAGYIQKQTRELLPVPFRGRAKRIAQTLIETANKYQMDPLFLMAVIKQESRFNPNARGSHGEIGLMQIKPSTALAIAMKAGMDSVKDLNQDDAYAQISSDLTDPVKNIELGAAYLSTLRVSFKHKSNLYISAYNMGAKRVRNHIASGVQPRIYSDQVLARYTELSGGMADSVNAMNAISNDTFNVARTDFQVFRRTLDL